MHLTPGLRRQTDKLLRILADNQGISTDDGNSSAGRERGDVTSNPAFKLLQQCHEEWRGHRIIAAHMVEKAQWIPSGSAAS